MKYLATTYTPTPLINENPWTAMYGNPERRENSKLDTPGRGFFWKQEKEKKVK